MGFQFKALATYQGNGDDLKTSSFWIRFLTKIVVDLTNIERIEFEILRVQFPIMPGEPAPALASVLKKLVVSSTMLWVVIEDPTKKTKLGMEDLQVPRRHQRMIARASRALSRKLVVFDQFTYIALMFLVASSNHLFLERGEEGITDVFRLFNKPIALEQEVLIGMRPEHFDHRRITNELHSFAEELQASARSAGPGN